jgi:alkylated DNA repair dioxygenase AlkB
VSDEECQEIANMATKVVGQDGEDGFFTTSKKDSNNTTKKVLNTGESRGRIYDTATRFPPSWIAECDADVAKARSCDDEMPEMNCTHLLLSMYTTSEGLVWHRDIYKNDGKSNHPVINLCVGASCLFGFKHEDDDKDRTIVLRSGDVLLFGGPCCLIKHAVLKILLDDCPKWMKDNPCRFSFTFRDSPEVLGREEEFKYFRVSEHLVGQESFQVPKDRKSFQGLPSSQSQRLTPVEWMLEEEVTERTQDETEVSLDEDFGCFCIGASSSSF